MIITVMATITGAAEEAIIKTPVMVTSKVIKMLPEEGRMWLIITGNPIVISIPIPVKTVTGQMITGVTGNRMIFRNNASRNNASR